MPELPEVETVRRGLEQTLKHQNIKIEKVITSAHQLRFPYPQNFKKNLQNHTLLGVKRRAKYLVISTSGPELISHLGMTGSWRFEKGVEHSKTHDHVRLFLSNGMTLVYHDPRRFGFVDLIAPKELAQSRWFEHLGPEPLDDDSFTAEYLFAKSRKKHVAVKVFLMDQKVVVGVGNIYASEALFRSGIRPNRPAHKLKISDCEALRTSIQEILLEAIEAGGSTIRDYVSSKGESGYFQKQFSVYGRAGEPCHKCGSKILSAVMGGRSTFWCRKCQK